MLSFFLLLFGVYSVGAFSTSCDLELTLISCVLKMATQRCACRSLINTRVAEGKLKCVRRIPGRPGGSAQPMADGK